MIKYFNFLKYSLIITSALLYIRAAIPVKKTYVLSKEYTVSIKGTSNLHDWDEKVERVSGNSVVNWNSDEIFDLDALDIKMDVRSIKSDMGSIMNNNTYKALKADANPQIIFTLKDPLKSIQANSKDKKVTAKGTLTIAGVTKTIDIPVNVFMPEQATLEFQGAETIKMTDYGVEPPTALFGTLKTANEVTINFKTSFTIANKP